MLEDNLKFYFSDESTISKIRKQSRHNTGRESETVFMWVHKIALIHSLIYHLTQNRIFMLGVSCFSHYYDKIGKSNYFWREGRRKEGREEGRVYFYSIFKHII